MGYISDARSWRVNKSMENGVLTGILVPQPGVQPMPLAVEATESYPLDHQGIPKNFKKLYVGLYFGFCINIFLVNSFWKHQFSSVQPSLWSNSHICTCLYSLAIWTFVSKVTSLLFNTLSRFVIAFLLSSKHSFHWCFQTVVLAKTFSESLRDKPSQSWGKSTLNIHWKDWCLKLFQ